MEDQEIITLYWNRDESAIAQTDAKYGGYCNTISYNIVASHEDAEECVSETWMRTWNAIPPQKPQVLPPFLAKIVRNLSIDCLRRRKADRRGGGVYDAALEELAECAAPGSTEDEVSAHELAEAVNRFLHTLSRRDCGLFLDRYFYLRSTAQMADKWKISYDHVGVILHRTRAKLAQALREEGLL